MGADKFVRMFADFLTLSWSVTDKMISDRGYTSDESSRDDWVQANWELLVERKILPLRNYLEAYGSGADFNGSSSRITDFEEMPTHCLNIIVSGVEDMLNESFIGDGRYPFDRFVGFADGFYVDRPPFTYVLVSDGATERVFALKDVGIELREID